MNRVFKYMGTDIASKDEWTEMNPGEHLVHLSYWFAARPPNPPDPPSCGYASASLCAGGYRTVDFNVYHSGCNGVRPLTVGWLPGLNSFRSLALHELGHVLGLLDTQVGPSIMNGRNPVFAGDTNFRMIWPMDINAVRWNGTYGYGLNTNFRLRTLPQASNAGVSTVFESSGSGCVSVWYGSL